MELVKSRSNTNYLILWCLGFSAYKIRKAMLISLGAVVTIVKVRTLLGPYKVLLGSEDQLIIISGFALRVCWFRCGGQQVSSLDLFTAASRAVTEG